MPKVDYIVNTSGGKRLISGANVSFIASDALVLSTSGTAVREGGLLWPKPKEGVVPSNSVKLS